MDSLLMIDADCIHKHTETMCLKWNPLAALIHEDGAWGQCLASTPLRAVRSFAVCPLMGKW